MLIGTMLVRNEADRWLRQVLKQMKSVCDKLIILDDYSTDNTPEICKEYGDVYKSERQYWGFNEIRQRKHLWELGISYANDGDWILCLDADETIPKIDLLLRKIKTAEQYKVDGLAFKLYDMWNQTHYRDDIYWCGHNGDWLMCVKYDASKQYEWCEKVLHCGRFPVNACSLLGRTGLEIQHWGWSTSKDREIKYNRYKEVDPDGKYGSINQYNSILDPSPYLKEFNL